MLLDEPCKARASLVSTDTCWGRSSTAASMRVADQLRKARSPSLCRGEPKISTRGNCATPAGWVAGSDAAAPAAAVTFGAGTARIAMLTAPPAVTSTTRPLGCVARVRACSSVKRPRITGAWCGSTTSGLNETITLALRAISISVAASGPAGTSNSWTCSDTCACTGTAANASTSSPAQSLAGRPRRAGRWAASAAPAESEQESQACGRTAVPWNAAAALREAKPRGGHQCRGGTPGPALGACLAQGPVSQARATHRCSQTVPAPDEVPWVAWLAGLRSAG